ncbi:MAG: peptide deformylase [Gemmatimonadaceae bacterium]|nr:peptide deformylase [Gloeobacterales cyanobacterium ES-bin-141]
MTLRIAQLGEPILHTPAVPIIEACEPAVQKLIGELILTLQAARGVGIAAPQVGVGVQLLVVASRPNPRYPDAPLMDPLVLINPRLLGHSDLEVLGWEGCLSVPERRGLISRYQAVEVEYIDRDGRMQTAEMQDFVARIFQHEYDHLLGKVFPDRAQQILSEDDYQAKLDLLQGAPAR